MSKKNDNLDGISPLIPLDWFMATGDKSFLKLAAVSLIVNIVLMLSDDGPKPYNKDGSSNDDPSDFVTFLIFDLPVALMMSFASFLMQPGALGPDSAQPFSGAMGTSGDGMGASGDGTGTSGDGMGASGDGTGTLGEELLPGGMATPNESFEALEPMIGENGTLNAEQVMSGEMDFELENQGLLNAGENALTVDNVADMISSAPDTKIALDNIKDLMNKAQSGLESEDQMNKIDELLDDYMDESGTEDNNSDLFGSE